jgi:tetratricopeptide (TPR) repeat protein
MTDASPDASPETRSSTLPTVEAAREALAAARAGARQPDLLRAYRRLGRCYLATGRVDEAESALRTAIAQARIHGDRREVGLGLLELGHAQRELGRADRALLAFTEAAGCLKGLDPAAWAAAGHALQALTSAPGGAR